MSSRSNVGYLITNAICIGDTEYVLGENPDAPARFATWACRDGDYYYWGHYTNDRLAALRDLLDRAGQKLQELERQGVDIA